MEIRKFPARKEERMGCKNPKRSSLVAGLFFTAAVIIGPGVRTGAAQAGGTSRPPETWKVTYIANEGFLIETRSGKILCDALFGGFEGNWCDQPSAETIEKMKNAEGLFQDIGVITVSHPHTDHFNPEILVAHVLHNPKVRVFCPRQVEEILAKNPAYEKIKSNITAVTPPAGQDETVTDGALRIRILRLDHGPYFEVDEKTKERVNLHRNVENLAYVFETAGLRMLHTGDAGPSSGASLQGYGLTDKPLDLAFLDRTFCTAAGLEIIEKYIRPDALVYMHIKPGDALKFRGCIDPARATAPPLFVFEKPMDSRVFSKRK
jgi:L-ascorbate metabolism protein UlaG (beta-lactamase superfamily)